MAARVRIDCIVKDDRLNPYERIQRVGGPNAPDANPPRWNLPLDDAIRGIQGHQWDFYVRVGPHEVGVIVAKSRLGSLFLRTTADYDTPDNLLSLPTCP
jgi:hypothetical protein